MNTHELKRLILEELKAYVMMTPAIVEAIEVAVDVWEKKEREK